MRGSPASGGRQGSRLPVCGTGLFYWHDYTLKKSRSTMCWKEVESCQEIAIDDQQKAPQEEIGRTGGGAYKLAQQKDWYMIAAISGSHTLGRADPRNSGYKGHWGNPCDQATFDNSYYKSILYKSWKPQIGVNGNAHKNQWVRADKCFESDKMNSFNSTTCAAKNHQLMLDTDMCLAFRPTDTVFASNKRWLAKGMGDCCAWTDIRLAYDLPDDPDGENRPEGTSLFCNKDGVCDPAFTSGQTFGHLKIKCVNPPLGPPPPSCARGATVRRPSPRQEEPVQQRGVHHPQSRHAGAVGGRQR